MQSSAHRPSSERAETEAESPEQGSLVSDSRLVEETRQGNRAAFGVLVQRYERRLIRVILRFINDLDLAEDLAQETFLRVYERLSQFDPSRRFSPWLFRIGVNLTLDYHRRKKKRIWTSLFTDRSPDRWIEPAVADPRIEQDLRQEVRLVVDQLPDKYRTVLVLRDMENFSTSEIAAILDRKEATIRWRLAEARTRFQELWEKQKR
ncbi:RNA polymerase sigma factor [Planctomicrobium piriforme]|uniref:RNA polymerase sigma factor n=1 Tax=Planctomicrobium piriforme TaxID=1576369 RepID=A0A1I3F9I1_9PLAN|nr:sigma-70 family RNA polymerase sigma factor [Planctomicrobium piriforme]SFI07874.1 RNA polymerase sigma-70 factor, ECF subfamily [Planctomicrobium piriforme]